MSHNDQKAKRTTLKAIIGVTTATASFNVFPLSNENQNPGRKSMKVVVIVNFEAQKRKLDSFAEIMNGVKTDLATVNGCIDVNIFQNAIDARKFTLVETWESKELHQANLELLASNGTWEIIASHLTREPQSDYFIQY